MAYIYHIVTPKGTYVGQAKGDYVEPKWPEMSLRGNLNNCRLWWHFNNAYVQGTQENWDKYSENDTRAEKEVASVLRCYSPGQIKVRVFLDSEDYGISKEAYKLFIKSWLPNATRVAQKNTEETADPKWQKLLKLLDKIKHMDFSTMNESKKRFINSVKNRKLSDAEKLDLAEIMHIYFLQAKAKEKLLNTQMGGQMTGWYPIMETKLGIDTSEKVLYREMTPDHARRTMDNYLQSTHEVVKTITNSLNETTKKVFSNQNFWSPVIDYIIDDPNATLFQHIVNGDSRSVTVKELSKLVDKKITPIKQEFVNIVNNQIASILQDNQINMELNIADFFNDKNFGIINWDEILDWLTGYVYNIVQDAVENSIDHVQTQILKDYKNELKPKKNLYKSATNENEKKKWEQEIQQVKNKKKTRYKEIAREVQSYFKTSQSSNLNKWKHMDFYRNGVFKVGTMIDLNKLNKLLQKSSKRTKWQDSLKITLSFIDDNYLKSYSMILFYDFYTNAVKSMQDFPIDIVGKSGERKNGDFVQYAKIDHGGHDPEKFLNRKVLMQYRKGGMKDTAAIRQHWHQAFTSMFYLAEQKRVGKSHNFIVDSENISNKDYSADSVRVIHTHPYRTHPNPVYIVHDFPKNIWAAMQIPQGQAVNNLRYY